MKISWFFRRTFFEIFCPDPLNMRRGRGQRKTRLSSPCPVRGLYEHSTSYKGMQCWAPLGGACIPRGQGLTPGVKRGVFDPLFGQPDEETRPFTQTVKPASPNFPLSPTEPSAHQTERFRPLPLPTVFGHLAFSAPNSGPETG